MTDIYCIPLGMAKNGGGLPQSGAGIASQFNPSLLGLALGCALGWGCAPFILSISYTKKGGD